MSVRRVVVLSALVAIAAVASVALAQKPKISVVTGRSVVPQSTQGAAEAKCAKGRALTGIGISFAHSEKFDGRSAINSLTPVTRRQVRVFLDNEGSNGGEKLKAIGLCRGERGFFTVEKTLTVNSGDPQFNSVTAKCPSGSSVVGGGATLSEGYGEQQLLASMPKRNRGWKISAFTHDSGTEAAVAICNKKGSYVTESKSVQMQAKNAAKRRRTNIDDLTATAKCAKGDSIVSGGFDVGDNDETSVLDLGPKGEHAWFARVRFFGFSTAELTTYAVCRKG